MASRSIVERLRSRTPVSVGTPVSVLILCGIVGSVLGDLVSSGLPMNILGVALALGFGLWLVTAVDRLWNMRAREASKGMLASLAITTVLLGAGAINAALNNGGGEPVSATLGGFLAPVLAYLAVREFVWLRHARLAAP